MQYSTPVLLLLFVATLVIPSRLAAQQTRCAAGTGRSSSPDFFHQKMAREEQIARWVQTHHSELEDRAIVTIPVVVHVIWNKDEENISEAQILSQIEVLNRDFRALNAEIPGIPAVFKDKIGDIEMEFCMASRDSAGNATNGITRTFTNNSVGIGGTMNIHYTNLGGRDAWNPEKYLNIWVAKFSGGVGGTSSFPGEGPLAEDGVQVDYRQFGDINTIPPYHLGRTCTHEIGHYFNLEHVWGPSFNSCCNEDDFVADTPVACESYLDQCPVHPVTSCTQPDMFMNYLFYTDDACMGMFTKGQKSRMLAALNQFRPGLLSSNGCLPVGTEEQPSTNQLLVHQNPVGDLLEFTVESRDGGHWQANLYDIAGRKMISKKIEANVRQQYSMDFMPPGLYFLWCENEQKTLYAKIVVSK